MNAGQKPMACMKAEACCRIVWPWHPRQPAVMRMWVHWLPLTIIAEEKVPYLHGEDATQLTRKNASERALVTKNCRGALPWGRKMGMIRKAARDYRMNALYSEDQRAVLGHKQALTLWTETRRGHRTGKDAAIKSTRRTHMCPS
ncbi:uncharacterized protein BO96DRAFT_431598 [Aspergillus niger CBS 101883]|uniref:uncharacterized protein n=1 Tax=Aspergillus lacticoffeatus (strain CBS 101883) TaxID=1450533 RepID=UPI000D7F32A3|nr:uncharacterized protein BO96DRAFT_431598 [Aspergillus niger CBS 101883]PYH59449.1 hypothetical protein BO96DRAFT_431598 [Aspergillus niger CBS 101883]